MECKRVILSFPPQVNIDIKKADPHQLFLFQNERKYAHKYQIL